MGYRASWLAVKTDDLDAVLQVVGLVRGEELHEAVYDIGHYAVKLATWWVVIGDGSEAMHTVQENHAQVLSAGTEALYFTCNDTSMCARLVAFQNREQAWSLDYDGSNGPGKNELSGAPPALVATAIANAQEEQNKATRQVDYLYDAAPEIGLALTGFRHDQTLSGGEHLPILVLST